MTLSKKVLKASWYCLGLKKQAVRPQQNDEKNMDNKGVKCQSKSLKGGVSLLLYTFCSFVSARDLMSIKSTFQTNGAFQLRFLAGTSRSWHSQKSLRWSLKQDTS